MSPEHQVGIVGTALLAVAVLLMVRSVLRGRAACREFERRLPREYAAHDSPRPSLFLSPRNTAYTLFLFQRRFESLSERALVKRFDDIYRQDTALLKFIFVGFSLLGIAWLWLEFGGYRGA